MVLDQLAHLLLGIPECVFKEFPIIFENELDH